MIWNTNTFHVRLSDYRDIDGKINTFHVRLCDYQRNFGFLYQPTCLMKKWVVPFNIVVRVFHSVCDLSDMDRKTDPFHVRPVVPSENFTSLPS